jgi:uncharacterized protein YjgD (DUF1641 family)
LTVDKIVSFEENGQILEFIKEQREIVEFLTKNDVSNFVNAIDSIMKSRNNYQKKNHRFAIGLIVFASVMILLLALMILWKISQAEKQHYT